MSSFNLEISDYCEECGNFLADVDIIDITTMGGNEAYMTNIRCKNHPTCERLYQRLKDRGESKMSDIASEIENAIEKQKSHALKRDFGLHTFKKTQ